jgi:hypothetical protein
MRCRAARRPGRSCGPAWTEQWPAIVGKRGREAIRRIQRLGELEELRWIEPATAGRPLDRGPDVVRRPDPDARSLFEQRTRLVRFVEAARDDHRIRRRFERLRESA